MFALNLDALRFRRASKGRCGWTARAFGMSGINFGGKHAAGGEHDFCSVRRTWSSKDRQKCYCRRSLKFPLLINLLVAVPNLASCFHGQMQEHRCSLSNTKAPIITHTAISMLPMCSSHLSCLLPDPHTRSSMQLDYIQPFHRWGGFSSPAEGIAHTQQQRHSHSQSVRPEIPSSKIIQALPKLAQESPYHSGIHHGT